MKQPFLVLGVLLLLWETATAAPQAVVKVGAVFAKTGGAAAGNAQALNGIRFAVDELNRGGGLLGRQIRLLEFDNTSTALGSRAAAADAVSAGVAVVLGANWSSHSLAMAPILEAAKIPMISPYSTLPGLTSKGRYIFRVCFTDLFQGRVQAAFARNDLGAETAGLLINADSAYSEGLGNEFVKHFAARGGRILFVESYLENAADFSNCLRAASRYRPDVLVLPGYRKDAAAIIRQAGQNNVKIPFIGGDGWSDDMYEIAGPFLAGNYYTQHWHRDDPRDTSQQFVEKYERLGRKVSPDSALGEDCVGLFVHAVKRAGRFAPGAVRDALAATKDFMGVTGLIRLDGNRNPVKPAVILRFGKEASEYVKTIEPE